MWHSSTHSSSTQLAEILPVPRSSRLHRNDRFTYVTQHSRRIPRRFGRRLFPTVHVAGLTPPPDLHDDDGDSALSPGLHGEEEVLNYFVRRLEGRGWDSQTIRESVVSTAPNNITDVWQAMRQIYGLGVKETGLMESPWLENVIFSGVWDDWTSSTLIESVGSLDERDLSGGTLRRQHAPRVWLKMENTQPTGSFKVRGACNAMLAARKKALAEGNAEPRFTISSTGNHALACIHALGAMKRQHSDAQGDDQESMLDVYLPSSVSRRKLAKIEHLASQVGCKMSIFVLDGVEDCVEAEIRARQEAEAAGRVYISPYNDEAVIAGQGTISLELLMELPPEHLDMVFVPVGGGGLISGVARVLKTLAPHVHIVGCQAAACAVMAASVDEGSIVRCTEWNSTLAEGLAGSIESDSCTFEACKTYVDSWVTVSEKEIAEALVGMHGHHGQPVEGSAAVALAAIVKMGASLRDKGVVGVVCGGNLDSKDLDRAYDIVRGRDSRDEDFGGSRASAF